MCARLIEMRWMTLALLVGMVAAPSRAQEGMTEEDKPKDIVAVVKGTPELSTFHKLVQTAGLTDLLREKGPFTVLAPEQRGVREAGRQAGRAPAAGESD